MTPQLRMTREELISYLLHTQIPTLLVEGDGDEALFRRLEQSLDGSGIGVMSVGGKGSLHAIYTRRAEMAGKRIAFLRDRDEYVAAAVPGDWGDYILTVGYSIENDILHKPVLEALAGESVGRLRILIGLMSDWFRAALSAYLRGEGPLLSRDVSAIVDDDAYTAIALAELAWPLEVECSALDSSDSWVWMRGKTLLRVLQFFFSGTSQLYSKEQLVDISIRLGPSENFQVLTDAVRARLG